MDDLRPWTAGFRTAVSWHVLAAAVLALVAAAFVFAHASGSAADEHCPSPGDADTSFVPSSDLSGGDYALRLVGGGWGHAVGMSQYGARGAAELGCSYRRILEVYYRGTSLAERGDEMPAAVRVGFLQETSRVYVTAEERAVRWRCLSGACAGDPPQQPAGAVWQVRATSDGTFVIREDGDEEVWRGGAEGVLRAAHEGSVIRVTDRHPAQGPTFSRRVKWGFHQISTLDDNRVRMHAVQHVTSGDGHSGMERYLWGIGEVPSSWPMETLKAQVVSARTYAAIRVPGGTSQWNRCHCDLYTDVRHQNYTGWAKESEGSDGQWGRRWRDAVNAVGGVVLTHPDSSHPRRLADTFYSSSHGGWSENSEDVWTGVVPWLRAVDSSRWENAGGNPFQRWERGFTRSELESRFDLDEFTSFRVRDRGAGGRPVSARGDRQAGAEVRGIKDGQQVTRRYSGEQLRWTLGVRSGLVFEAARRATPVSRHAGDGRIATAVAVSENGWTVADTVVIARADDFADALAGTALAGAVGGPMLITDRDRLAPRVAEEVQRLDAVRAVLLGGPGALDPQVEEDLREAGVAVVDRVHGADRAETAAAIADELRPVPGGTAFVVGGLAGWPDALSVSGIAARRAADRDPWPVLLAGDRLPAATRDALARHDVRRVEIVGGTGVVAARVEDELRDLGYDVVRRAGADRYATSRVMLSRDGAGGPVIAVTGANFPDGLAAGALAAQVDGSILLVRPDTLNRPTGHRKWIRERITRYPELIVVGGDSAVRPAVVTALRQELRVR